MIGRMRMLSIAVAKVSTAKTSVVCCDCGVGVFILVDSMFLVVLKLNVVIDKDDLTVSIVHICS